MMGRARLFFLFTDRAGLLLQTTYGVLVYAAHSINSPAEVRGFRSGSNDVFILGAGSADNDGERDDEAGDRLHSSSGGRRDAVRVAL